MSNETATERRDIAIAVVALALAGVGFSFLRSQKKPLPPPPPAEPPPVLTFVRQENLSPGQDYYDPKTKVRTAGYAAVLHFNVTGVAATYLGLGSASVNFRLNYGRGESYVFGYGPLANGPAWFGIPWGYREMSSSPDLTASLGPDSRHPVGTWKLKPLPTARRLITERPKADPRCIVHLQMPRGGQPPSLDVTTNLAPVGGERFFPVLKCCAFRRIVPGWDEVINYQNGETDFFIPFPQDQDCARIACYSVRSVLQSKTIDVPDTHLFQVNGQPGIEVGKTTVLNWPGLGTIIVPRQRQVVKASTSTLHRKVNLTVTAELRLPQVNSVDMAWLNGQGVPHPKVESSLVGPNPRDYGLGAIEFKGERALDFGRGSFLNLGPIKYGLVSPLRIRFDCSWPVVHKVFEEVVPVTRK